MTPQCRILALRATCMGDPHEGYKHPSHPNITVRYHRHNWSAWFDRWNRTDYTQIWAIGLTMRECLANLRAELKQQQVKP